MPAQTRGRLLFAAGLCGLVGSLAQGEEAMDTARRRMVEELSRTEGITNVSVLEAMQRTPRHEFVAGKWRKLAYYDMALPIGHAQTATPPSAVAYMTQQLDPQPRDRVLEIGTGCGYQAAVLSHLVRTVYTIEIVPALGRQARATLRRLKCDNVQVRVGDGYQGWAEMAPFDKIIVTCSPEEVPQPLVAQLADGGRMIVPLGEAYQQSLCLFVKRGGKLERQSCVPTVFVPMTGAAEAARKRKDDPLQPALANGSFEQIDPNTQGLAGWYHQRQLTVEPSGNAPDGRQFVTFRNRDPGRAAHASQAFAIDGRRVGTLSVSGLVRGERVQPGPGKHEIGTVSLTFYDHDRQLIRQHALGDWRGTFDWTAFNETVPVPAAAREAVLQIGLEGATGSLSLDQLAIVARAR